MDRGTIILLALTFFIAFAATALLVPPVMRLCRRRGWLAQPGAPPAQPHHRWHQQGAGSEGECEG